jgi:hypothetical protein
MFAKAMAAMAALGFLFVGSVASACDYCGGGYYNAGYYGGGEVYSCNEGRYDCHYESNLYRPRYDGCGDGCHVYRGGCHEGCRSSYREGFRDGFVTGTRIGDDSDRGFYDDGHRWHDWQRWQDHDGSYHDGWRGDDGHWHDRSEWHGDHYDGEHHDGDDHRDGDRDGDHHDGDRHHDDGH